MFDVAPTEFLLVAIVALIVIGPKDLPKAMRVLGYWVGRMRGVARQFRSGFDNMVREAELEEMEKRWAAENARIMAEHPASPSVQAQADVTVSTSESSVAPASAHDPFAPEPESSPEHHDATAEPVHVEMPEIRPAPGEAQPPRGDGVTS
jgi:sec-independent protein translocase protein TatB